MGTSMEGERLIGMQSFQLGHMKQLGITKSKIQGENHSISTLHSVNYTS